MTVRQRKSLGNKRKSRKISESIKFYRALLKNALDFTSILDKEGNFIFQTATARGFLGYKMNELKGKNVFDFIHPEDLDRIKKAFFELVRIPMRSVTQELRFRHKNGTFRWIESTGLNLLRDPDIRGIVINSRDIHERRVAEELLRKSEQRYKLLAESSHDLIIIIDRQDRVSYINTCVWKWFGVKPEEIIGSERSKLFPVDISEKQRRNLEWVFNSGEPLYVEGDIKFRDKKIFAGTWLVPLKNDAGETYAVMVVSRDLTERRNLEESLREEKRFSDTIIESIPGVFYLFDEDLRFIRWNKNITRVTNYTDEEIERMSPLDFILEDDRELVRERIKNVFLYGYETVEARVKTKDSRVIPFLFTGTSVEIDNKKYLLGIGIDITDKKIAEEHLKKSEALFRGLIENTYEIFTIINEKGEMVYHSPSMKRIMGFTPDELTGENAFNYVHPDDVSILAEAIRDVLERPGKVVTRQMRMKHRDGSWRYIESTGYNLLHDPAIRGIVINSRDITEQKELEHALMESETKFRGLVEKSLVGVYIIQDGFFAYVNPKFAEIFGYTQSELIMKVPVLDLVADEDRELVAENLRKRINGEVESLNYQFIGRKKDGTKIYIEVFGTRTEYKGKPAVIGTLLDVTERKRLQEQLFQSQKLEAVGRLAGGIAHDFNNLLTLIMLHSEMILKQLGESHEVTTYIKEIYDSANRASNLTAQLLSFARRQIIEPVVFNVNTMIKGITKMLKSLMGEHIVIEEILAEDLYSVKVDPAQLEHSIINIAINARDAMPSGGKLIIETQNIYLDEVYAKAHAEVVPGDYVLIAISDNGMGMTEEVKSRIFEPFFTTKKEGKGTGLGLASVYGFIKQSGGHIWVYSEPGKGTTFKIYLPAFKERIEVPLKDKEEPEDLRGRETILLAEDEPAILDLLTRILESYGYTVIPAKDGIEALEKAEAHTGRIDLLLTDLIMPRMGGRDLYNTIKEKIPNIQVIFMSGYTDNVIVKNFVLEDGINFLQKPFRPQALLKKIRQVLGG